MCIVYTQGLSGIRYQVDGTDLNKEEKKSPDEIIDPC